jgi:hypothetical protein
VGLVATKEDFVYALEKLAKEGDINDLAHFYKACESEEDKKLIESALVRAIKICRRNGKGTAVMFLRSEGFGDDVLLEAIEACRSSPMYRDDIAKLLKRKDASDRVMITAMEICNEKGKLSAILELVRRKDLSDAVMIKTAEILVERRWSDDVRTYILEGPNVSDRVKEAAGKIIERTEREERNPIDLIGRYLEKNRTGGNGVLSEKPKSMRRSPERNKTRGKQKC